MKNTGNFLNAYQNFKVSKIKAFTFALPALIVVIALCVIIGIGATTGDYANGVNIGIDFQGGTMLTVTLGDELINNYDENVNKIVDAIENCKDANGNSVTVSYIQKLFEPGATSDPEAAVTFRYKNVSDDDTVINELNENIIAAVDALYPDIVNDEVNFITYESIGATAAQDLLSKAGIIIAYSINNTIIIFDRCREYIKPLKGQKNIDYDAIGDTSVRENMRRSIFTTATTMITVVFLAILGSESIREFCVPIILGLLAGVYSSVFLATPMWAAFSRTQDKIMAKHRAGVAYASASKSAAVADEDGEIMFPDTRATDDDDDDTFEPQKEVKVKPKNNAKPKGKPIYKYSKKNTTFKKK